MEPLQTCDEIKIYFANSITFLTNYSWIFNFAMTHLYVDKILEKMPQEWREYFNNMTNDDLNALHRGKLLDRDGSPDSLKGFIDELNSLKINFKDDCHKCSYKFPNNSGLSAKKQHEILLLAPLIHEISEKASCKSVLDIGTGLGYLPQLLADNYGYEVIGIECTSDKINSARTRNSSDKIKYIQHFINSESANELERITKSQFSAANFCISGLHACADLSVTILDLFMKLPRAKSLVVMPCCYHRLEVDEIGESFKHFPASDLLGDFQERTKGILRVPFLRLACQSVAKFRDLDEVQHQEHADNCICRAILQEVALENHLVVSRVKRKSGTKITSHTSSSLEKYLSNLSTTHDIVGALSVSDFQEKMREKWDQHKGDHRLVESLAALQGAMQSVCETVVLLDRIAFLKERGVDCWLQKVTDQGISPRCFALIADKAP